MLALVWGGGGGGGGWQISGALVMGTVGLCVALVSLSAWRCAWRGPRLLKGSGSGARRRESAGSAAAAGLAEAEVESVLPTVWRKVGHLSEMFCWPVKSCGPVVLDAMDQSMDATSLGLQKGAIRDRFVVVADSAGRALSARTHPRLLLITPEIHGQTLSLTCRDRSWDKISVDLAKVREGEGEERRGQPGQLTRVRMWNDEPVLAVDCGDAAAAWLRRVEVHKRLQGEGEVEEGPGPEDLRLMYYPVEHTLRLGRPGDPGAYAEDTSYMLMTEASLADLNSRLSRPVSVRNFRPNFLVRGAARVAFEEDSWKWVRIGGQAIFKAVKPCIRCSLTTIDPETAVKSPDLEPLRTLRSYRMPNEKQRKLVTSNLPLLGVLFGLHQGGPVAVGDDVYVGMDTDIVQ